ncbi:MAG: hypothetical protein C0609_10455 [Deltaproteobacteria bacterium]|nr:MAG: hypothetical protein C0609_10455 [Deltaproteobacteria bacterium]
MSRYAGPKASLPEKLVELSPGVWLTSGRMAVIEGKNALAVIDPGDEPFSAPEGPLDGLREVMSKTGKPLAEVWVTHSHPDHIANLPEIKALFNGLIKVVAHENSPVNPDAVMPGDEFLVDCLATPGHSAANDDLAFYLPAARTLFSGDIVQPKGERWERAFYPSPWPFFTDGDTYLSSLDKLLALDFDILVTGHREVRFEDEARRWVEVTRRAIFEVANRAKEKRAQGAPLNEAARNIFLELCSERGITKDIALKRFDGTPSSFDLYDLPGVEYYYGN